MVTPWEAATMQKAVRAELRSGHGFNRALGLRGAAEA